MIRHLLGLCLVCVFSHVALAVEKPPIDIQVSAEIPWVNKESYTPVNLFIESIQDDELSIEANYRDMISAERTVTLKKGFKHRYSILIPSATTNIGRVNIKWKSKSGKTGSLYAHPQQETRSFYLGIIEQDSTLRGLDFLDNIRSFTGTSGYGHGMYEHIKSESIPDYWQGIPLWATFLMTPKAEKGLQKSQRIALCQWIRAGGTLYVSTKVQIEEWKEAGVDVALLNNQAPQKEFHKRLEKLALQDNGDIRQYRVPGTDQVPTGAFITIMIIFVLLVGPVNYLWVRKKQQLHLFLITTPLISFVFSVVMGAYGLLADGLSAYRSTIELSYIDHTHKQSCTWTSISWFSGLSPGSIKLAQSSSLQLANDSIYEDYYRRENRSFHTNWTQQQVAEGDWLHARKHQQIQISTPRPEERRLIIKRTDNGYTIQNGFDVNISKLTWYDEQQNAWSITNLDAGAARELSQKRMSFSDQITHLKRLTVDVQQLFNQSKTPSFFHAVLEKPIHAIPGPEANDAEAPRALLCGRLEVQP